MKVAKVWALMALIQPFVAIPAHAQEVFTIGLGTNSCGKWIEAAKAPVSRAQYRSWVLGFLTGVNWHSSGPQAKVPDGDAAVAFMDEYCRHNSLHMIALGAAALVQESGGPKAQHDWKR
jgi:hypothetical protein